MGFYQFLGGHPWLLVGVFAVLQLGAVVFTLCRLNVLSGLWKGTQWNPETNEDGMICIGTSAEMSDECAELVSDINKYIKSHDGAVEYGVIKDKIDRKVDSMYDYATSMLQFPTYLGLLGTFIGVWIGLACFQYGLDGKGAADSAARELVTDSMIRELIGGIIVSMVTSVIGLFLMIGTSVRANKVLKESESMKEGLFQFLQEEIIPKLGTNVSSSLNRLQNTIRKFEPSFQAVIDDFKTAFTECTDMFKGSFADNVSVLTHAVEAMGCNMQLINENIQKQEQLLTTLRQRSLVETLDKFVTAAASFESVSETVAKLEDVRERILSSSEELVERQEAYNRSLEIPETLVVKINAVLDRVVTFERSLNEFGENMNQTQLFRNEQLNLIEEQLKALKAKTAAVMNWQDVQADELKDIYRVQSDAVSRLAVSFRQAVDKNGADMETTMSEFSTLYGKIVSECRRGVEQKLEEFTAALNRNLDFVDAGKKLDNLGKLQTIDSNLSELRTTVLDKSAFSEISAVLQSMESRFDALERKISDVGIGREPVRKKRKSWFLRFTE